MAENWWEIPCDPVEPSKPDTRTEDERWRDDLIASGKYMTPEEAEEEGYLPVTIEYITVWVLTPSGSHVIPGCTTDLTTPMTRQRMRSMLATVRAKHPVAQGLKVQLYRMTCLSPKGDPTNDEYFVNVQVLADMEWKYEERSDSFRVFCGNQCIYLQEGNRQPLEGDEAWAERFC